MIATEGVDTTGEGADADIDDEVQNVSRSAPNKLGGEEVTGGSLDPWTIC